jgi:polyprenyl-phospho-N-acetylgalactosaminyl synthase
MLIYVIIPVYNDELFLGSVLDDLRKNGFHQIILVDDGSNIPVQLPASRGHLLLVKHMVNLGQGAALQTGMQLAQQKGADIIVHFDADGQHLAKDIPALIEPIIQGNADVVLGSRFLPGSYTNIPFRRKLLLQIARFINLLLTGIQLTDAHNGLRAFSKKAGQTIQITENRMAHATEIINLLKKHRLRWCEVPVSVLYTAYSRKKGQKPVQAIHILFDLILKKLRP